MKKEIYSTSKVLLIEDDPITNFMMLIKLRQIGIHGVCVAENRSRALEYLKEHSPGLIFLNIKMPTIEGLNFLEYLKKSGYALQAFVVLLTDGMCKMHREQAFQYHNVVDFIEKPLDERKIVNVLSKMGMKEAISL